MITKVKLKKEDIELILPLTRIIENLRRENKITWSTYVDALSGVLNDIVNENYIYSGDSFAVDALNQMLFVGTKKELLDIDKVKEFRICVFVELDGDFF